MLGGVWCPLVGKESRALASSKLGRPDSDKNSNNSGPFIEYFHMQVLYMNIIYAPIPWCIITILQKYLGWEDDTISLHSRLLKGFSVGKS